MNTTASGEIRGIGQSHPLGTTVLHGAFRVMHLQRPGALLTCGECQLAQIVYYGEAPGKRRSVEKQGWDTGPRCAACVHFYYRAMRGWAAGWTLRLASNQNEGLRRKAGAFKAKEPTRREEADTKRGSLHGARGRRAGCVAGGSRRGRQRGRSCVATEGPTFLQPSEVRRPRGRRAGCVAGRSRRGRQRGRSCVAREGPTFLQPSEVRRPRSCL